MKFGVIISKNSGNQTYLTIFEKTTLQKKSFIRTSLLEEYFKYDIRNHLIKVEYFNDEGFVTVSPLQIGLEDLLKDCSEVYEFAKKYYPSWVI